MNAIPWYKSQVLIGAVTSILSQALVLFGLTDHIAPESVSAAVNGFFELVAFGAAIWTAVARWRSPVEPVTLTKASAASKQGGYIRGLALAFLLAVSVPVVVTLPACAPFQEMSVEQRIRAAYQTHELAVRAVTAALDGHLISSEDAEAFREIAKQSRAILDSAWALRHSDVSTAEGKLQLANDLLLELQKYITNVGATQT